MYLSNYERFASTARFWTESYAMPRAEVAGSEVLYCNVLQRTVLCCTVLYCTVLHYTVLSCAVLYCSVLHHTILYCTVLSALHFTVCNYHTLPCWCVHSDLEPF
jgi:hypothetical protein